MFSDDLDEALRICAEMSGETGDRVARGDRRLHESLAETDPVLGPAYRGQAVSSGSGRAGLIPKDTA